jgi:hypothetical protein
MTYLWVPALEIAVQCQEVTPAQFWYQGRRHQVLWIAEQWRVDSEWWREPTWRDYFRVVTDSGLLLLLYHDLLEGQWYLQQTYD